MIKPRQYLESQGWKFKNYPRLQDIKTIQSYFFTAHSLPEIYIVPSITIYQEIPITVISSKYQIWSVRERYLFFDIGLIFRELSFDCNSLNLSDTDSIGNLVKINDSNLLTISINRKQMMCGNRIKNTSCIDCRKERVFHDFTLYIGDQLDHLLKQIDKSVTGKYNRFNLNFDTWTIRGNKQFLEVNNHYRRFIREIRDSIIWTSCLIRGITYNGNNLYQKIKGKLPPYSVPNSDFNDNIKSFISMFLFRFYFTHPDFILSKSDNRLYFDSLDLKCLIYTYDQYTVKDFWNFNTIKTHLPLSLIPVIRLYSIIRQFNHPVAELISKELNPHSYALPLVDPYYRKKISEKHQKICFLMAKHQILSIQPFGSYQGVTVSQLVKLLGKTKGRVNTTIETQLRDLINLELVEEIKAKKGRASSSFRLKNNTEYIEVWKQLAKLDNDFEIQDYLEEYFDIIS